MKKIYALLLTLISVLCACAHPLPPEQLPQAPVKPPAVEFPPVEEPEEPPCGGLEEPYDTPCAALDEPITPAIPYLEKVTKTTVEIMNGPGYGNTFVQILQPGTYTVVEEMYDEHENLWGRLKSGIGWIDLTYCREITNIFGPITVADSDFGVPADHTFVQEGYTDWGSHYLITAAEAVTGLQLRSCEFSDKGPTPTDVLYRLEHLAQGQRLAVTLLYYGDMTSYALTYTDTAGNTRTCTMMQSGRDGSLILQEYLK